MIPLKVQVQIATCAYGATKEITFRGDVLDCQILKLNHFGHLSCHADQRNTGNSEAFTCLIGSQGPGFPSITRGFVRRLMRNLVGLNPFVSQ